MIELVLNVNEEMRLAKTKFWKAMELNPVCDPDHITLDAAVKLTKEKKLESWWNKPGFKKWFSAEDEFELKVEAAKYTAIDTLMDVMSDPDSPASARVSAVKTLLDYTKKQSNGENMEKLLEKIAGVSNVEDLQKYIK